MSDPRRTGFFMSKMLRSTKGLSLVEIVLVMGIFMFIIIISSQAFNSILSISTQQTKSAESDTQGILGLEMLRVDLEHAGYGLPWLLNFQAAFEESQAELGSHAPGIDPGSFNDSHNASADTNKVPRALQAGVSSTGSDYLVLKSTLLGLGDANSTSKKWAYVGGVGTAARLKPWSGNNFAVGEKVITLNSQTKRLISNSAIATAADFSYAITAANMMPPAPPDAPVDFRPPSETPLYLVYGVSAASSLRVPYNRVDYYVKRDTSEMPSRCAPGTGLLYKAVMNHPDGSFTKYPLMECVADMQVVFNLDTNGDGGADAFFNHSGLNSLSAKEIREQLKLINVYVVAHEGGKDSGFSYDKGKDLAVGEGFGRTLDLEAAVAPENYRNYRWKTYKLSVTPKNINY